MKLSLSWIFDHLEQHWSTLNINELVGKFNTTCAEIDGWQRITLALEHFTLGTLIKQDSQHATVLSTELGKEFTLPVRTDGVIKKTYMLFIEGNKARWATLADWHSQKEGLIGAVSTDLDDKKASWKNQFEAEDYILTIDNKSITHRPDMWSHRGVAREIGALYGIALKPLDGFMAKAHIEHHDTFNAAHATLPFSITIDQPELCTSFAAASISRVANRPSLLWMAHRLARVDSRPIDAIVDSTNYVMFDIGQPMHAFDAKKLKDKSINVQLAKQGHSLELLDKQAITLDNRDIVIANGPDAVSLAGIMGGLPTAVDEKTHTLFIEAGCFNAGTIRQSSVRHKRRTESSVRFEKSLDKAGPLVALRRFLKLLKDNNIDHAQAENISVFGAQESMQLIEISRDIINRRLGIGVEPERILDILQKLGFECTFKNETFVIKVPTFRSSKELFIPEDIVEEVGRFIGYGSIPMELPKLELHPSNNNAVFHERALKRFCAYGFKAHEVSNYALYDEQFLRELDWQPTAAVGIQNPVSDNWKRMVTSLVPHLLKCVTQNKPIEAVRFFEYDRTWHQQDNQVHEKMMVAGCAYQQKNEISFFNFKADVEQLLKMFGVQGHWQQVQEIPYPWFHPYMTAQIVHQNRVIGYAGVSNPACTKKIIDGTFFLFEIDAAQLFAAADEQAFKFEPLSKYPPTWFDISLFIPLAITVDQLKNTIAQADGRIFNVALIDFYENKEWLDKRSVTFRFWARDKAKTLTHEDIDHIYDHVKIAVKQLGVTLR